MRNQVRDFDPGLRKVLLNLILFIIIFMFVLKIVGEVDRARLVPVMRGVGDGARSLYFSSMSFMMKLVESHQTGEMIL